MIAANAAADRDRVLAEEATASSIESYDVEDAGSNGAKCSHVEEVINSIDLAEARLKQALEADLVLLDNALVAAEEGFGPVREALEPGALHPADIVVLESAMQVG